jgi:hypothetical protein
MSSSAPESAPNLVPMDRVTRVTLKPVTVIYPKAFRILETLRFPVVHSIDRLEKVDVGSGFCYHFLNRQGSLI